jgi:CBS domain containing-hemolysin-like protein
MNILLLVTAVTLLVSGMCSLFEATLYSTRLSLLEAVAGGAKHRQGAERFIRMKRDISSPISAILILNTIANTAGASLAGMYAARVFGYAWVPAFSIGLTLAILFLAEVLPKTYGAMRWRQIWHLVVWPLAFIERLLHPAVRVMQRFSGLFTKGAGTPAPTEEEIVAMIRMGGRTGQLTLAELQLLNAVFHFDDLVCRQVMVPRRDVIFLESTMSLSDWFSVARSTMHTRYPITKGSPDEVVGILHIKDLLGHSPDDRLDLESLSRPIRHVPESMPISRLLRQMQSTRQHMAVVVDEYGTTTGIITLENILEQLVGSVQDEFDAEAPEIVAKDDSTYLVSGSLPLGRLNREVGLSLSAPNVDTLSGLLVSRLGRLLEEGDEVALEGVTARVIEAREGRAVQVLLRKSD